MVNTRRIRRIALRLLVAGASLFLLGVLTFAGLIAYYGRNLPDVSTLRDYRPPQTTRVLDRNGALIGEIFLERRTVIPVEQIPRVMVLSVLAAEDADFYIHEGLDYRGIARAIFRDIIAGRLEQGASTITQQVVKIMLLSSERSLARKMRELVLARRLEQELTKEEILHLYLNHINFGDGHYGVEEAALYYFNKHARDLTLAEASLLAGIPQGPTRLNPFRNPTAARRRQLFVLGQLESKREEYWPDLSAEDIQRARETEHHLVRSETERGVAPEVMRFARQALRTHAGQDAVEHGGYTVHTTIDLTLQRTARTALRHGLESIDERKRYRGPLAVSTARRPIESIDVLRVGRSYEASVVVANDTEARLELDVGGHRGFMPMSLAARYNPGNLPASRFAAVGARLRVSVDVADSESSPALVRPELGPQAALVVLDVRSRDVLALVGAYEQSAGFDRATQAVRQPGSTFKPFVYAEAMRRRLVTPASTIDQTPIRLPGMSSETPQTEDALTPIRVRAAIARSVNPVAMRLLELAEPNNVITLARNLGITTPMDPVPALALGASDVHPIELVTAYAALAAGGRYQPHRLITRIVAPGGRDVPLPRRPDEKVVLSPAEAFIITSIMRSVVEEGTAMTARSLRRPLAGKTGTSNDARDTWFVGFSPTVVAGVWVGFDDRRPLGGRESGARTALPIWIDVMRAAHGTTPPLPFTVPAGIQTAMIDPVSGLLAPEGSVGAIEEYFLEGTVPTAYATDPNALLPEPPTEIPEELPTPFVGHESGTGTPEHAPQEHTPAPAPEPTQPPPPEPAPATP